MVTMDVLMEEKETLKNVIESAINDFILKTEIYPIVKIIEKEMKNNCGVFKSLEIKVTVEI